MYKTCSCGKVFTELPKNSTIQCVKNNMVWITWQCECKSSLSWVITELTRDDFISDMLESEIEALEAEHGIISKTESEKEKWCNDLTNVISEAIGEYLHKKTRLLSSTEIDAINFENEVEV